MTNLHNLIDNNHIDSDDSFDNRHSLKNLTKKAKHSHSSLHNNYSKSTSSSSHHNLKTPATFNTRPAHSVLSPITSPAINNIHPFNESNISKFSHETESLHKMADNACNFANSIKSLSTDFNDKDFNNNVKNTNSISLETKNPNLPKSSIKPAFYHQDEAGDQHVNLYNENKSNFYNNNNDINNNNNFGRIGNKNSRMGVDNDNYDDEETRDLVASHLDRNYSFKNQSSLLESNRSYDDNPYTLRWFSKEGL